MYPPRLPQEETSLTIGKPREASHLDVYDAGMMTPPDSRALALALAATANLALAQDDQPPTTPKPVFGRQVSEGGIRHSFLITGSKTAIINEACQVVWEAKGRSRDGFVLDSGNILVSQGKEAREYTRDGEVVFRYRLSEENKELGTAVRLPNKCATAAQV